MVNLSDAFILIAIVVLAILVIVLVVEGKQMKTRPSRCAFLLIIAGIVFAPLAALIIFRILNEEEGLLQELPAYRDYYGKVRYRLVPGMW